MYISTKDWKNYINRLSALDKKAGNLMREWIIKHGFSDTKSMINYAYALAQKYGEGSAALSAEMYDAIAEMQTKLYPPAEAAPAPSYGEVAKTVNGILKDSQNPNSVANGVSRLVKRTGADTTLNNALRDGAEFAWVPNGDTCAFCIALASRGWQRMSKDALKSGHAEHIHANCDCTYAIRFDKKSIIEGYDPDKYLARYNAAEGRSAKEKINSLRRNIYQNEKKKRDINQNANNLQLLIEAENPFKKPKQPLTIATHEQSKHFIGGEKYNLYMLTHEYQPSYLTISEEEVQELIEKYHGTGILKLDRKGNILPSEMIVENDTFIGYAVNNKNGEKVLTTGFKIHYSDKGAHIVPMYENQKQYWKERRDQNGYDWLLRQKS